MAVTQFIDDHYEHIENELEQIQKCAGMYISTLGTEGALHLFKEIVNNSIDEANNIMSPCDKIDIYFNEANQHFIVEDNGRGIKHDKMVEFCTEKHTSTKYDRTNNHYSAGCFGVGMKVTNAYSRVFSMKSYREGKSKLIKFVNCELTEYPEQKIKSDKHGLVINFIPSEEILGPVHVTEDMCIEWLRHMSYDMPENLTITFFAMGDDDKIKYHRVFTYVGLEANVKFLAVSKLEFEPININWAESEESGSLILKMSFSYDKSVEEEVNDSYCNFVWTFEGGYHLTTCRGALCDFMVKAARMADPDSKYPVTAADVRKGLVLSVGCKWGSVVLAGQHKSSVTSKEIDELGRKGIYGAIADFFANNNAILNKLISYYRQMSKIRLAAIQMKGIKPPKPLSVFDESEIERYIPLADSNKKGYRELIITEGKSAAGAINKTVNHEYQAIYHTQGVLKNTAELTVPQMMKSAIPRELSQILGIEPGKPFDINNFKWNKIIFLQDADADGKNIRSLVSTNLVTWYPQLIEEGRLYAGMPPLYVFPDNLVKKYNMKKNFYYDKKEFQREYNDIVARNIRFWIIDEEGNAVEQTKREVISFLDMNKRYYEYLLKLAKTREACDPTLIEYVCDAVLRYGLDTPELEEELHAKLPEMKYDKENRSLVGAYESEQYGLIIDEGFLVFARDFLDVMSKNESIYVAFCNKNADEKDMPQPITIGQFFNQIGAAFNITAEQRFKGLGEAEAMLMFATSLNPKTRKLIRLTMEDRDKALETVFILHGKGDKPREARRKLIREAEITIDDLDN